MIYIENLSIRVNGNLIIDKLNLTTEDNGFYLIEGFNGSGKTTLLETIAGLNKNYTGKIKINRKNLEQYNQEELSKLISLLEQQYIPKFNFTVQEYLELYRYPYNQSNALCESDINKISKIKLITNITDLEHRQLNTLSGGQLQRVKIAASLIQDTPIILLDEPFTFLDKHNKNKIQQILYKLSITKLIIVVSH